MWISSKVLTASPLGAAYPVALPIFEGPLDLLLRLIETQELEISNVSLVAVTDQYLRTVERLEEVDPGALADFLVVASRLVYIKSRSLLPQPRPADEEEDEEEPADALVRQLIEYRRFKEVAGQLRTREEQRLRVYVRTAPPPELERRLELGELSLDHLVAVLERVLARATTQPVLPRVKTYPVTVAEQIVIVRATLVAAGEPLTFGDLLSAQSSRLEVIVTFLAVLELIKQRELVAQQQDAFSPIMLTHVPLFGLSDQNGAVTASRQET
jgi:segregation and condensation protein A